MQTLPYFCYSKFLIETILISEVEAYTIRIIHQPFI